MKYALTKTLAAIAGFCLIFGLLATVICFSSVSKEFYFSEYEKLGVAEDIGVSDEDLKAATEGLLDYTVDKRDDMVTYVTLRGTYRPMFNERETMHMYDVKNLYLSARTVGIICLIAGAVGLAVIFIFSKEKKGFFSGYLLGNIIFFAAVAVIAIYAAIDFYSFWTSFHLMFFTNDLWLLDPATDFMILMVPEQFFSDLVFKIIGIFAAIAAVLAAGSIVGLNIFKKKEKSVV